MSDGTDGSAAPVLAGADLPAAFRAAERVSVDAQAQTMRWAARELAMLVLAAAFSVVPGEVKDLRIGPFGAFVAFGLAIVFAWRSATEAPSINWHHGRAGAESIKTLAWRYAVAGEPFKASLGAKEADLLFQQHLQEVVAQLADLNWRGAGVGQEITPRMRKLRGRRSRSAGKATNAAGCATRRSGTTASRSSTAGAPTSGRPRRWPQTWSV